jgi:calcium-dependent protein kinase
LLDGYRLLYGADFNVKEVDALIEMADTNGDGKLSYSEWMMTALNRDKFLSSEKLEGIFSELDADGNNMISLDELNVILGASEETDSQTASMLAQAFADIDTKGNGEITFNQFKDLMLQIMQQ